LLAAAVAPPAGAGQAGTLAKPGPAARPRVRANAPVTVNFVNADIEAVTRAFAAMIDRQIVVDPRVKGTITVYSEQPQSVREAYASYLSALRGLGFAVVESAGLLKVVPEADAKLQTGTVSVGEVGRGRPGHHADLFAAHENPNNLVAVLRPLISANNTINASPGNNALVITDYADNLQRMAKIIAALDQPSATDVEIVPLQHAVASRPGALVQRWPKAAGCAGRCPAGPGRGRTSVVADARSNSLLVRAANPARLAQRARQRGAAGPPEPPGRPRRRHVGGAPEERRRRQAGHGAARGLSPGRGGWHHRRRQGRRRRRSRAAAESAARLQQGRGTAAPCPPGHRAAWTVGAAFHRRLHPGRPGHQLADHHRARAAVPPGARADRPARHAPRAGLHREHDRRGLASGRGRLRLPVAGPAGPKRRQHRHGRRHQFRRLPAASIIDINTSAATGSVNLGAGLNIGLLQGHQRRLLAGGDGALPANQSETNICPRPTWSRWTTKRPRSWSARTCPSSPGSSPTRQRQRHTNPFQTIERKDVGMTLRMKPQIGEGGTVRMTIFQEKQRRWKPPHAGTTSAGPSHHKSAASKPRWWWTTARSWCWAA
jgi:general secretion pathway protein D